jgi:TolB-like protein
MTVNEFFDELRRRRVFHMAGVYAVVCWFLVQIIAIAAPALGLPAWTTRLGVALTFLGVPVVLGAAWLFPWPRPPHRGDGSGAAAPAPPAATAAVMRAGRNSSVRFRPAVLALLGVVAISAAGALAMRSSARDGAAAAPPGSIVVLPFANLADADDEYFSDGITEDILGQLARIDGLRVISRTSATRYRDARIPLRTIAAELGVATVLEGSVRRSGDRVRVSVQLIDAATDSPLWSETYDRELADIFDIQAEIARRVAAALRTRLAVREGTQAVPAAPPTTDLEAYQLYLRGRYFWNRRTEDGLGRAIEYFEQALRRDPGFALAHAGVADALVVLPFYGVADRGSTHDAALAAAQRALVLDPDLGEAHAALGYVHFWRRQWQLADEHFQRARVLSPGYATALQWHAFLYAYRGRFDEAVTTARRALELDPLSVIINWNLGYFLLYTGGLDEALAQYALTLELEPGLALAHEQILRVHEQRGDLAAWLAEHERFAAVSRDGDAAAPAALTAAAEAGGWDAVLRMMLHSAPGAQPLRRAEWHVRLGEVDAALALLEGEAALGGPVDVYSPAFHRMREHPRFRRLRERLDLP